MNNHHIIPIPHHNVALRYTTLHYNNSNKDTILVNNHRGLDLVVYHFCESVPLFNFLKPVWDKSLRCTVKLYGASLLFSGWMDWWRIMPMAAAPFYSVNNTFCQKKAWIECVGPKRMSFTWRLTFISCIILCQSMSAASLAKGGQKALKSNGEK